MKIQLISMLVLGKEGLKIKIRESRNLMVNGMKTPIGLSRLLLNIMKYCWVLLMIAHVIPHIFEGFS